MGSTESNTHKLTHCDDEYIIPATLPPLSEPDRDNYGGFQYVDLDEDRTPNIGADVISYEPLINTREVYSNAVCK